MNCVKTSRRLPPGWKTTGGIFDVEGKRALVSRLEGDGLKPGYWEDNRKAQEAQHSLHEAQADLDVFKDLEGRKQDLTATVELLQAEDEPELLAELGARLKQLQVKLERLDFTRMLSGPYDRKNAL